MSNHSNEPPKWYRNKWVWVVAGVLLFIVSVSTGDKDDNQQQAIKTTETKAEEKLQAPKEQQPAKPAPQRIETTVKEISDSLEVTVWKSGSSGIFARTDSDAPYEVIVNATGLTQCSSAKLIAYNVYKSLYNSQDKDKLTRVMVNMTGSFRSSLGATDGLQMTNNNLWTGPTNFFTVFRDPILQGEKESGEVINRTWIVSIHFCPFGQPVAAQKVSPPKNIRFAFRAT